MDIPGNHHQTGNGQNTAKHIGQESDDGAKQFVHRSHPGLLLVDIWRIDPLQIRKDNLRGVIGEQFEREISFEEIVFNVLVKVPIDNGMGIEDVKGESDGVVYTIDDGLRFRVDKECDGVVVDGAVGVVGVVGEEAPIGKWVKLALGHAECSGNGVDKGAVHQ